MRFASKVRVAAVAILAVACEQVTAPVSPEQQRYDALLAGPPFSLSETRDSQFAAEFDQFHYWSGMVIPGGRISSSEVEWSVLWDSIQTFHMPKRPPPAIDFTQEMVVLIAMGGVPSGGYDMRIRHVTAVRDTVFVLTERVSPASDCAVTAAITAPSDARVLPSTTLPVVFLSAPYVNECEPRRRRPDW